MKQVTIPAQWLQELIALCGPEDHELRERVMKSAAPAPADALATATGLPAQSVEPLDIVQAAADAASVGHLSHLIDYQSQILARAMAAMKAVELTASPIDEPHGDLDARIPYEAWATFVDARAALLYDVKRSPVAAPQAQADARDAEQERWMEIGKAIERACIDQPESTEIVISLERDAGTVTMFDPDGNEHDQFSHEDGLAGVVNEAIDAAIAAAKGEQ